MKRILIILASVVILLSVSTVAIAKFGYSAYSKTAPTSEKTTTINKAEKKEPKTSLNAVQKETTNVPSEKATPVQVSLKEQPKATTTSAQIVEKPVTEVVTEQTPKALSLVNKVKSLKLGDTQEHVLAVLGTNYQVVQGEMFGNDECRYILGVANDYQRELTGDEIDEEGIEAGNVQVMAFVSFNDQKKMNHISAYFMEKGQFQEYKKWDDEYLKKYVD